MRDIGKNCQKQFILLGNFFACLSLELCANVKKMNQLGLYVLDTSDEVHVSTGILLYHILHVIGLQGLLELNSGPEVLHATDKADCYLVFCTQLGQSSWRLVCNYKVFLLIIFIFSMNLWPLDSSKKILVFVHRPFFASSSLLSTNSNATLN